MKLFYFIAVSFFLVYLAECQEETGTESPESCFASMKDWRKNIRERIEKKFAPVFEECKTENATADDKALRWCAKGKVWAAMKECKSANDSMRDCMAEKLHVEKSEKKTLTNDEIKEKILSHLINESKKEAVSTALATCDDKEGREYWMCCLESLSNGPCPEIKPWYEKIVSWRGKWGKRKDRKKN